MGDIGWRSEVPHIFLSGAHSEWPPIGHHDYGQGRVREIVELLPVTAHDNETLSGDWEPCGQFLGACGLWGQFDQHVPQHGESESQRLIILNLSPLILSTVMMHAILCLSLQFF